MYKVGMNDNDEKLKMLNRPRFKDFPIVQNK